MELKLIGNKIMCLDVSPKQQIGEFNGALIEPAKGLIILNHEFGSKVSKLLSLNNMSRDIEDIHLLVNSLDSAYIKYVQDFKSIKGWL